jgi:hypothetical protein
MKSKIFLAALLLAASCGPADLNAPYGGKVPPAQVTLKSVKNVSGGAIIYYDRPADVTLKYVRAVYTVDDEQHTTNASYYTDSILVDGFGDTTAQVVNLYSVSYGDAASEPVPVTINPKKPTFLHVMDSLTIEPTYGGISISTSNEVGAAIAYGICRWEETDSVKHDSAWVEKIMVYSKAVNFRYSLRKQKAETAKYAVFTKDRWGRRSGLKEATITPWEEAQCDPSKGIMWNRIDLDTDGSHGYQGGRHTVAGLWDKKVGSDVSYGYHSTPFSVFPQSVTINLGQTYTLSRIVMHGRFATNVSRTDILTYPTEGIGGANGLDFRYVFKDGYPKKVEIWIARTAPSSTIKTLDKGFKKVGEFMLPRADGSFTPSTVVTTGTTGDLTADDIDLVLQGQEFEIPKEFATEPVQFVVFNVVETYGNSKAGPVMIDQLSFFGAKVK